MDNVLRVHVLTGCNELYEKVPSFRFGVAMAPAQQVHQALMVSSSDWKATYPIFTKLDDHVNILFILKAVVETDNVRVRKGLM